MKNEYGIKEKIEFAANSANRWLVDHSANWPKSCVLKKDEIRNLLKDYLLDEKLTFKNKLSKEEKSVVQLLLTSYFAGKFEKH